MRVRISKPSKTAMQSGSGRTGVWLVEAEAERPDSINPLTGWASSAGTQRQIRMAFETLDEALRFVEEQKWDYTVSPCHEKKVRPRNYADNFRYVPPAVPEEKPAPPSSRPHSSTG